MKKYFFYKTSDFELGFRVLEWLKPVHKFSDLSEKDGNFVKRKVQSRKGENLWNSLVLLFLSLVAFFKLKKLYLKIFLYYILYGLLCNTNDI